MGFRDLHESQSFYGLLEQHVISYPVSPGQLINCIGFVTIPDGEGKTYPDKWVRDASREELLRQYEGWEPELQELLEVRGRVVIDRR